MEQILLFLAVTNVDLEEIIGRHIPQQRLRGHDEAYGILII
jgi:hypothetical protein